MNDPGSENSPRGAHWLAVLNPTSGRGRAGRDRARIIATLRAHGVDAQLATSEYAGHAPALVQAALDEGVRHVLAIGGDGTVHEAVNAILLHGASSDVTFACLPVGTGNDWCRGLGIGAGYAEAAARCARSRTVRVDVGEARLGDGHVKYFANVCGAGFDAHVVQRLPDHRLGRLAYLATVVRALVHYRPQPMHLAGDAGRDDGRQFVVFACIGGYCGGGMRVAPGANSSDGLLDIVAVGDVGRLDALASLRRLFDGTIASHPKVRVQRTKRLTIETTTPIAIEADGELIGTTPVTLSVLPGALRVVVP